MSCRIVLVGGGGVPGLKYPHIRPSGATTVGEAAAFGRRHGSWGGTELFTAADAPRAQDGGPLSWSRIWKGGLHPSSDYDNSVLPGNSQ